MERVFGHILTGIRAGRWKAYGDCLIYLPSIAGIHHPAEHGMPRGQLLIKTLGQKHAAKEGKALRSAYAYNRDSGASGSGR